MSLRYRSSDGTEQIIAGLTPGGDIEAGAVAQRSGTVSSGTVAAGATESVSVTFDSPMPDDDYIVNFNTPDTGRLNLRVANKTANGFTVFCMNNTSSSASSDIEYTAFKTYTVQHDVQNTEAIANIQAAMPSDAGINNKLATKAYVDNAESGLDSRLDDIEDVVPTTASITNKLVTQDDLNNVQIDALGDIADVDIAGVQDGQTILWNNTDSKWEAGQAGKVYTAGDGISISNLDKVSVDGDYVPLTFVGTKAQWDALTVSQKAKYTLVDLTDDPATGNAVVVDTVTIGSMNPITSNAVARKFASQNGDLEVSSSVTTSGQASYRLTGQVLVITFTIVPSQSMTSWTTVATKDNLNLPGSGNATVAFHIYGVNIADSGMAQATVSSSSISLKFAYQGTHLIGNSCRGEVVIVLA